MIGIYYDGKTSQAHACSVDLNEHGCLEFSEIDVPPVPVKEISVSDRLASLPRQIFLPDGALFETQDQQGVDELIEVVRGKPGARNRLFSISFYETNAKALVAVTLLSVLVTIGFFFWGVPLFSAVIAANMPAEVKQTVSAYTIKMLDDGYFDESKLTKRQRQEVLKTFSRLKKNAGVSDAILLFRGGMSMGANAFALPGGEIIVTDELVELSERPAEVGSVLLHELAHVKYQHGLRKMVESVSVYIFISLWIGDVEAMDNFSVLFLYALLDSKFSRDYERQADVFVLDYARDHSSEIASGFVGIMEKIESTRPGAKMAVNDDLDQKASTEEELKREKKTGELIDYLSSHPITEERLEPFREFVSNAN